MKNTLAAVGALAAAAMLSACSPATPPMQAPRPVLAEIEKLSDEEAAKLLAEEAEK